MIQIIRGMVLIRGVSEHRIFVGLLCLPRGLGVDASHQIVDLLAQLWEREDRLINLQV